MTSEELLFNEKKNLLGMKQILYYLPAPPRSLKYCVQYCTEKSFKGETKKKIVLFYLFLHY